MAISLKKWKAFTDQERLAYVRKGQIIVKPIMGISAKAKVGSSENDVACVKHQALVRGIRVALADTEEEAYKQAHLWLAEWDGSVSFED